MGDFIIDFHFLDTLAYRVIVCEVVAFDAL